MGTSSPMHVSTLIILETCYGLLTGQRVPILMCLEKCAFRCRSCPIFARTTLCLCHSEFHLSFATSAQNEFQLSPRPLRTRPGYTQVSMFQHSPFCASVTTGTALSEDKKTGLKDNTSTLPPAPHQAIQQFRVSETLAGYRPECANRDSARNLSRPMNRTMALGFLLTGGSSHYTLPVG